jgi:hypothetical protein
MSDLNDLAATLNVDRSPIRPKKSVKPNDGPALSAIAQAGPIPPSYREVKLTGSMGKLQAPAILHFRNFTVEESLLLAQMSVEEETSVIIQLLNACVWEDFECGLLHIEDAKEIMLNIYGTWWGSIIEVFYYPIDENEPMGTGLNRSVAEIPVSAIHIDSLGDGVKDPITLTNPETSQRISFIQPCMIFGQIVSNWIKAKFMAQEVKFNDFKWDLRENEKREKAGRTDLIRYNVELEDEYEAFEREKIAESLRIDRALRIKSVNGVELTSVEEKLKALESVPLDMWYEYRKISDESFSFGVQPEVEFTCSVKHVLIKRRFSFRCMDFVPTVDDRRVSPYAVSFG